ncbi:ATP-binding protein [Pseudodesulfovibrio piezophilus]|uniref:ATP-binding protein n=1 Tax=Pseudodesulfovibrio piezophilus TaxID=879567 RepID=UPI001E46D8B0|nr:ATP-binding protein [Pseudodesulfovibrio piezophilus]
MCKFTVALGSMLALILFVATTGYIALDILEGKAAEIVADSMRMQRLALEIDSRLQLAHQAERDFVLRIHDLGFQGARTAYAGEFKERVGEAGRNIIWLQDMMQFSQGMNERKASRRRLEDLHSSLLKYNEYFQQLVSLATVGGAGGDAFERKTGDLDGEYLHLTSLVRQLAISASDGARNAHEEIAESSVVVKYVLGLFVFFALLMAASIVWVLNRTVAKSVIRLSDAATELSLGNLEARAHVRGDDEFGQLARSINAMASRITNLVNDLEGQAAMASDRLFEAIDSISEGFLLYDQRERLLLVNRRIHEMAGNNTDCLYPGTPLEEVLRFYAESGVFVNAMGRENEWVQGRLKAHRGQTPQMEEPMNDGRWFLIKTYRTNRGESVVILSDITERKRTVENLASINSDLEELVRNRTRVLVEKAMELKHANERLRELDELKSAFLSSVSHELRTPLTSLLGFSKIIKRDFMRTFMPLALEEKALKLGLRIQGNLDIIGSEGERLTRLINDVLDLSRIESGKESWRFTEVDMAGALNRAVSSASGLFAPKPQVKLVIRRFDPVPFVHCDPDRLHQVLINLLSNAAKFTDYGEVAVDLFVDGTGMIRVQVQDTGKGIEKQCVARIFDKFHQAHKGDTLTEKPAGTGLGLAICRQIVERYDGRIWAESALGKGTTMHMVLPPAEPPDAPLILVVDDDESLCDSFSLFLKKEGYGVRTARDGEQALDIILRRRPALITMDLDMPGMDGWTLIDHLRQSRDFGDIPLLVISGISGCHTSGGDATLFKPVDRKSLLCAVNGLLGKTGYTLPVLALTPENDVECYLMPELCGTRVTRCSEEELWRYLERGFEGTVMVPDSLAGLVDLKRLCDRQGIQVLFLPVESVQAPEIMT